MTDRRTEIGNFLETAGWEGAVTAPLAGDASARRYEWVVSRRLGKSAVLMDAPLEKGEDTAPFLAVGRHLLDLGLSAPEIYATDPNAGLILMEDFGDDLFARVCDTSPDLEVPLYQAAVDLLVWLHRQSLPSLPLYSMDVYEREARLVTDWYLPAATGQETAAALGDEYAALIRSACDAIKGDHSCCTLRDYHAENLLWLPSRAGVSRVGLLDFQDALIGHPAYDLVSLLEDARRDTDAALQSAMIDHYIAQSGADRDSFRLAYATLGAQRNLKIIGIFARLCRRDGKPAYMDMIPRVWAHLERDLQHPALAELKSFVAQNLPLPSDETLSRIKAGAA